MKSKKNTELNFLYLDDKYNNTNTKKKSPQKKVAKKPNKKNSKSKKEEKNEVFDFDNEIVIGVTKLPKEQEKKKTPKNKKENNPKKSKNSKLNKNTKATRKSGAGKKSAPKNIKKQKTENKVEKKKKSLLGTLIKWTILLSALIASIIFFMMSPLFDVSEINVIGNSSISEETIISLSEIKIGDNIYKTSKEKIKQKIKQNAYVESVQIKRIIPNKIELTIKERNATYMLEYANSFVYINNQGYILEISTDPLDVPIIMGYTTNEEELQAGKRLNTEDLNRLETVLKIIESTQVNGIIAKINRIDILNKQDYILHMDEEKKIVHLGDASNLSSRMLYLKAVLDDTHGLEGEIFVNGDLVKEKAFFRQKE
ncbi:MAG: FtsQ-type POTRA domain-containing protein [Clostridia bacterium]|nr:FtsQ-type POTRA domain-containing protein [Clostridia bacterium]